MTDDPNKREVNAAAKAITNLARIGRGIRLSENEAKELAVAALKAAAMASQGGSAHRDDHTRADENK